MTTPTSARTGLFSLEQPMYVPTNRENVKTPLNLIGSYIFLSTLNESAELGRSCYTCREWPSTLTYALFLPPHSPHYLLVFSVDSI